MITDYSMNVIQVLTVPLRISKNKKDLGVIKLHIYTIVTIVTIVRFCLPSGDKATTHIGSPFIFNQMVTPPMR